MISRTHPVARRLRALRRDPELRAAEGVLVAEGIHLAQEALTSGSPIELAVISPGLLENKEGRGIAARLRESGVDVLETSDETIEGLQDARSPQSVVLVVRWRTLPIDVVIAGGKGPALLVIACGVQDPGNLGALMRTAEAAGATGFLATGGGAELTHPRAVRATMGSIFRLPSATAPQDDVLDRAAARGCRLLGAAARGAAAYDSVDWIQPLALLLGGEGAGLPEAALSRIDTMVAIPMAPLVESLSVGAAAAVLLFEAARARRGVSRAG